MTGRIKIHIFQMKSFRRASDEANEDFSKRRRQEVLKNVLKRKLILRVQADVG